HCRGLGCGGRPCRRLGREKPALQAAWLQVAAPLPTGSLPAGAAFTARTRIIVLRNSISSHAV
ncbi:hypothetical protein GW17_00034894, partial [Ensete ventricosum]